MCACVHFVFERAIWPAHLASYSRAFFGQGRNKKIGNLDLQGQLKMPKRSQKEEIEAAEPSSSGTEQSSGSGSDDGSSGSESGSEFPDVSDEEEESSGSGDDVQVQASTPIFPASESLSVLHASVSLVITPFHALTCIIGQGSDAAHTPASPSCMQELQVDFEFFSPEEKDFLGLKSLLVPYLNSQEFDSSALIDAIIAEVCARVVVDTTKTVPHFASHIKLLHSPTHMSH